jgi:hypothetical protein
MWTCELDSTSKGYETVADFREDSDETQKGFAYCS